MTASTVFKMDSSGVFGTLHTFGNYAPNAEITQGDDGNLYGTTSGTIFRIDSSDTFSTPVYWSGPRAGLLQGTDGNLYGTTSATVFEMDFAGHLTTLHTFNGADGSNPTTALIQAADDSFYGTASGGGPGGQGVIFRLSLASLAVHSIAPASGPASGGTGLDVLGGGFLNGATLSIGDAFATGVRLMDPTVLHASTPALRPGTLNDVSVANPGSTPTSAGSTIPKAFFADFRDVPQDYPFHGAVEKIFRAGITVGCGSGDYCPHEVVSGAQIAIFLARALAGGGSKIPSSGTVDGAPYDCTTGGISLFTDVTPTDIFCKHVHYLADRNVNTGCAAGLFCPDDTVTRLPMVGFVANALVAPGGDAAVPLTYGPDTATGRSYSCDTSTPNLHFTDIAATDPLCKHAHYLWAKGIIDGCSATTYCSGDVTRDAMAKFLVNAFK